MVVNDIWIDDDDHDVWIYDDDHDVWIYDDDDFDVWIDGGVNDDALTMITS